MLFTQDCLKDKLYKYCAQKGENETEGNSIVLTQSFCNL